MCHQMNAVERNGSHRTHGIDRKYTENFNRTIWKYNFGEDMCRPTWKANIKIDLVQTFLAIRWG
jgi:hypothetical protein